MVTPEPCKELKSRTYLWLGLSLTNLHLPDSVLIEAHLKGRLRLKSHTHQVILGGVQ